MDLETQRAIQSLTAELLRTQGELERVKRGGRRPQLGHSSIESGALEVRDPETGVTRLRLGYQPDGSVGAITEGGDPPPTPSTPQVEAMASGLRVTWDGALADAETPLPSDFDHVNVHVSTSDGFTPSPEDFVATIPRPGGMLPVAPLAPGTTYRVRLVGVGTGGVQGGPSAQASGTPTAVTDIEPGAITEVEIADDAISSPKIRAETIQALHIAAEQIQAGHIEAAAVTASKLAAELVLSSRIIAGNPGGGRVEIDGGGIRGYSAADELVFVIDDAGDVVFSGTITSSEITGSRMTIGDVGGTYGLIEQAGPEAVHAIAQASGGARGQLFANGGKAEVSAMADSSDATAPAAGLTAESGQAGWTAVTDPSDGATPAAGARATSTGAQMDVRAARDADSSRIRIFSGHSDGVGFAAMELAGPPPQEGEDAPGTLYGFRQTATDIHVVSLQSPVDEALAQRHRSLINVEAANASREYAQVAHFAQEHVFSGETVDGTTSGADGTVTLAQTHSLSSVRHRPLKLSWLGVQPSTTSAGTFLNFTETQYERDTFRTGASGLVRIDILAYGRNQATGSSLINVGFWTSLYDGDRTRSAELRVAYSGEPSRLATYSDVLEFEPDTSYLLVPQWRLSSGAWTTDAVLSDLGPNHILITPMP